MLNWLRNAFRFGESIGNLITGASLKALWGTVTQIFSVTYAYWHTVSGHVLNGWQELTRTLLYFRNNLQQYLFAQYLLDVRITKHDIPFLSRWISWLGGKIQHDLGTLRALLQKRMDAGDAKQHSYSRSILVFVLIHVLGFLYSLVKSVFGWINGIGSTMWHYFTHLAEFADLLIMFIVLSLEKRAWDIGGLLGKFFLSLLVRNVVRFATLVETIVDAVL